MQRRALAFAFCAGLWASLAAFAQNPCAKLLLFPLHDPGLDLDSGDRSFFNAYELCSAPPGSEPEAREAGIDLKLAYAYARISPTEADRFDRLKDWMGSHCPDATGDANSGKLDAVVRSILSRQSPAVRQEYERCLAAKDAREARRMPSCHAVAVGGDAVALLVIPPAGAEGAAEPRIVAARATGALLPDTFQPAGEDQAPVEVESLAHLKIPESGLLRLFARRSGASAVSFEVETSAGRCSATVTPPPNRDHRIWSLRGPHTPWKEDLSTPCSFKLGDDIWIDVAGLPKAIEALAAQRRIAPADAEVADLVPILDGHPLAGVHPINPSSAPDPEPLSDGQTVHHLKFHLERNDANKASWSRLLNDPFPFTRRVEVTLGFENGAALDTWVTKDGTEPGSQAFLVVVPPVPASIGGLLIGSALLVFLLLAGKTDIIRDTTAPLRPDGRYPYSLAKAQMAFWFFLVISAYFVLWMITGDKDTITGSVVVLIGISAGTALGAAFVDSGKSHLPADGPEREAERERRERREREFFSLSPGRRALYDLLADDYRISFHRFQIFVWTLVLGVIFVTNVLHDLAMPEFSPTLLAVMGLSGGTYLGFKLPEQKTG
jgi:hypothetical protein